MYRTGLRTFFTNYPLFLCIAFMFAGIEAAGLRNHGVTVVVYALLAMFSHRIVLLEEDYGWRGSFASRGRLPVWAFFWRYGLLGGLFLIAPMLFVMFSVLPHVPRTESGQLTAVLITLLVAGPIFGIALSIFGTWLPAAATGGDASFGSALRRGLRRFLPTLARLTFGPGLLSIIAMAIGVALSLFGQDVITSFALSALAYYIGMLPLHMTAVVLSLAYLEGEGRTAT